MRSKTLKNSTEASLEHTGFQFRYPWASATGPEIRQQANAVSDIVSGLCESLKNVQKHRLLMHEEIKNILNNHMVTVDRTTIPDRWTFKREED
jgi:hypothetical protein